MQQEALWQPNQLEAYKPQVRPDIIFGPPENVAGKIVYYLKDNTTNWFYRIGEREHFLISRMDGQRSLAEIGEDYYAYFGRHLNEQSWAQLFSLLNKRLMLIGSLDESQVKELRDRAAAGKAENARRGFMRRRFKLANSDALLEKVYPWVRFVFRRGLLIPLFLCILVAEAFLILNIQTIIADALAVRGNYLAIGSFLMLTWVLLFAHEMGHALSYWHFGGRGSELGIIWRYLMFIPYSKVDDILLFHNRMHRIYIAFAGVFVNLLAAVPLVILWHIAPADTFFRTLTSLLLLSTGLLSLINLIPFIQLDGYFMLNYALGMLDMRKESRQFWLEIINQRVLKRGQGVSEYPTRAKRIYFVYGILSFIFTACFLGYMLNRWARILTQQMGTQGIISSLVFIILYLFYRRFAAERVRNRFLQWRMERTAAPPG